MMSTHSRSNVCGRMARAGVSLLLFASASVHAHPTAATTKITLDEVLQHARVAANRDAWQKLEHGLFMTGTSDTRAIDSTFELTLSSDGRYHYATHGQLAITTAFDGDTLRQRERSGPVTPLVLGSREAWHLSEWIHSGFWLDSRSGLTIEKAGESDAEVTLILRIEDSPTQAKLTIDRQTWLPQVMTRRLNGRDQILAFLDYETVAGIPMARLVETRTEGAESQVRIENASVARDKESNGYIVHPSDVMDYEFDLDVAAQIELKQVPSGHLLVHPMIEGKDVGWFILDSGAGRCCVDTKVADRLGLEKFGAVPAMGVGGVVPASFRQGKHFQLGPLEMRDTIYVELELSFLSGHFGMEIAGICGYDLFARSVVALDLETLELNLFDPTSFELEEGDWGELVLDSQIPCIRCSFEGERSGLFKIDLGDPGTIAFYSPAVESLQLLEGRDVQASQIGGVGGSGRASSGILKWFEIGGQRVEALDAIFSQSEIGAFANPYALGNLGSTMLRPFRLVFDYTHRRIALQPRSH
ncbi:MAG: putative aspartyl protease [Planctomycetota bacterium]|jgi:hypothetical protein